MHNPNWCHGSPLQSSKLEDVVSFLFVNLSCRKFTIFTSRNSHLGGNILKSGQTLLVSGPRRPRVLEII